LMEIASTVGSPIDIDGPTRNRSFSHYAHILVDIDLSKKAYDEVLVERDGFAFMVEVQYERRPLFCHHCYSIGHNITTCRWLNPQAAKEKVDRGKQPAKETVVAPPNLMVRVPLLRLLEVMDRGFLFLSIPRLQPLPGLWSQ
jgi:hypothetical protein